MRPDEGVLGSKLAFEIPNGCQVPAGVAGVDVVGCNDSTDSSCDKSAICNADMNKCTLK